MFETWNPNLRYEEPIAQDIQRRKDRQGACRTIRATLVMLGFPHAVSWTDVEIEQACAAFGKALAGCGLTVNEAAKALQRVNTRSRAEE